MRHLIIAAFVNLTPGTIYHPPTGDPVTLGLRQRVTPPGSFESHDEEQVERLIRARCLKASDTAVGRVPGAVDAPNPDPASLTPSADAVSHAAPPASAPSATAVGEAVAPVVEGSTSPPVSGETQTSAFQGVAPAAAPADAAPPAPAAADAAPPAPVVAPAPAAAPPAASGGGAGSGAVAAPNGGGSGDGAVSHRERRKRAREQAK